MAWAAVKGPASVLVLDVLSLHASGSDREGVLTHKTLLSVSFLFCRAKFCLLLPAVSNAPPDFAVLNLLLDGTQSGISLSCNCFSLSTDRCAFNDSSMRFSMLQRSTMEEFCSFSVKWERFS